MKRDYFYVMDYAAVLHDDNPTILFVGCVKSKWSNRISNFSKKKMENSGYLFMTCYWQRFFLLVSLLSLHFSSPKICL